LHQNRRKFISLRKKAEVQITVIASEQNTAALNLGSVSQKLERRHRGFQTYTISSSKCETHDGEFGSSYFTSWGGLEKNKTS